MSNPRLLAQLAKDAGVTVGPALYVDALSAPGGPADSYLKLMRHNVTQLARGHAKELIPARRSGRLRGHQPSVCAMSSQAAPP